MLDLSDKRVVVTGGAGFLGTAVCRVLAERGCNAIVPRKCHYELVQSAACQQMYDDMQPEVVIHLAADCGGIGANQAAPGRFFYANMAMALNLIEGARIHDVEKFVLVGTTCSYPSDCPVPFDEDDLWCGYPEASNAPYGIAKKAAGVMLDAYCRQYGMKAAYVLPANLYGPSDNFDPETSHVIPAMIRKFADAVASGADTVECWGTGRPTREFLYVEDAAEAIVRAAECVDVPLPINLGTGRSVCMANLAARIAAAVGYRGEITWNASYPDGQAERQLDTQRAADLLDWKAETMLQAGIGRAAEWYLCGALV